MNQKIVQIAYQKLKYFNYAPRTIESYIYYIRLFVQSQNKRYKDFNGSDFSRFLLNFNYTSISQQSQVISSLKFFYKKVLQKRYEKVDFSRPRKVYKIPTVLDVPTTRKKILGIQNLKHKSILSLAFSSGLRVSEILNLKLNDIDSKRMVIHVRQSKRNKDREAPLSDQLLEILREYYKRYKPSIYLFNGQKKKCYSYTSCNKIATRYLNCNMHDLRHTFATHLLETGTDLKIIQKILGHSSYKSTEIYLHVSRKCYKNISFPI